MSGVGGVCRFLFLFANDLGQISKGVSKSYGLKAKLGSLTTAFASVAILLQFDEDLMFEEHLQLEYCAENLWWAISTATTKRSKINAHLRLA